jgi:hypothetical protein
MMQFFWCVYVCLMVVEFELRASSLLDGHSTTWATPLAPRVQFYEFYACIDSCDHQGTKQFPYLQKPSWGICRHTLSEGNWSVLDHHNFNLRFLNVYTDYYISSELYVVYL